MTSSSIDRTTSSASAGSAATARAPGAALPLPGFAQLLGSSLIIARPAASSTERARTSASQDARPRTTRAARRGARDAGTERTPDALASAAGLSPLSVSASNQLTQPREPSGRGAEPSPESSSDLPRTDADRRGTTPRAQVSADEHEPLDSAPTAAHDGPHKDHTESGTHDNPARAAAGPDQPAPAGHEGAPAAAALEADGIAAPAATTGGSTAIAARPVEARAANSTTPVPSLTTLRFQRVAGPTEPPAVGERPRGADDAVEVDPPIHAQFARGLAAALRQGGGTVTMRLSPETLGPLVIQVRVHGATVDATVVTASHEATAALDAGTDELRLALEDRGLSVSRLLVLACPELGAAPAPSGLSTVHTPTSHPTLAGDADASRDGSAQQRERDEAGTPRRDARELEDEGRGTVDGSWSIVTLGIDAVA